jgi:murein DD-endopeptidase MepM/ murein hydrolase activator NlpD
MKMDKHFTVTIHDESGIKQFNLHNLIKKAFFYAVGFILSLIIFAIGTILYLQNDLHTIEQKRSKIEQAYQNLKEKNTLINANMNITKKKLSNKKQELEELSDSLEEIEKLIGLKPLEEKSLKQRVDFTKQTSQQRATILTMIPSGSPIEYHGITSKFGYRTHPTLHKREFHRGSDMKAKMGTPVHAPADGIVEWAGYHKKSGFGNLVILQHNYGFKTYYGHLKKVAVKSGSFVKKGDIIAYTGNSGLSNGPHLHYEVRFLQRPLNPFWFIKWTQENYYQIFEKEKKVPWKTLIDAISRIQLVQSTIAQDNNDTNSTLQPLQKQ